MPLNTDVVPRNFNRHLRIMGTCWLLYGVLRLVAALWLIFFARTATVMFGALLTRVPDPFALMSDFHLVYTTMIVLSVICGVAGCLAGIALLAGRPIGRTLASVAAFLSISSIPLGTTLGIYTLVVLFSAGIGTVSSAVLETRSTRFREHPIAT